MNKVTILSNEAHCSSLPVCRSIVLENSRQLKYAWIFIFKRIVKYSIILHLLLHSLLVYAQQLRTITIDAEKARPLNLSEFAEHVTPIVLETSVTIMNGNVLLTNEYLFATSISSIVQYDLTGKFVRTIDCGGFVTDNATGDTIKKELYVPVGNIIKCFDYSGKLKKEFQFKNRILHILFHDGILWVQSYHKQSDNKYIYAIDKINLSTGEIFPLSFSLEYSHSGIGRLTLYNNDVVISFGYVNNLYQIHRDVVIPVVQWNINPPAKSAKDLTTLRTNGFTGNYLFINYRRDDTFYTYLENMKTGEKYNTDNIVDDVFNTDNSCRISPLTQHGYFFFSKSNNDIKGNSVGNKPLKNGPVIFIVKTK